MQWTRFKEARRLLTGNMPTGAYDISGMEIQDDAPGAGVRDDR